MRNLRTLDRFRRADRHVMENWGWAGDETCGMFTVPSPIDGGPLSVVASAEGGWDHVSVSRPTRCPNWPEMTFVASLFFADNETAMQLHVPSTDHVNNHPYCLHWWRPTGAEIPRPPSIMVGVKDAGLLSPERARLMRQQANEMVADKMASAAERAGT